MPTPEQDELHKDMWEGSLTRSDPCHAARLRDRIALRNARQDKAAEAAVNDNPRRAAYYEMWARRA